MEDLSRVLGNLRSAYAANAGDMSREQERLVRASIAHLELALKQQPDDGKDALMRAPGRNEGQGLLLPGMLPGIY